MTSDDYGNKIEKIEITLLIPPGEIKIIRSQHTDVEKM